MNWAAVPKNCARFCHRMRVCPTSRDAGFVDERGGLQRVIGTLAAQRRFRERCSSPHDRHQRIERAGLAVVPGLEQTR